MNRLRRLGARLVRPVSRLLPARFGAALEQSPEILLGFAAVGIAVLMRLNNGVRYPALHGFDSYGHVTYIWYLLRTGEVPTASEGWSFFHPPLFYVLAASIWKALLWLEPRQVLKVISTTFSLAGLGSAWVSWRIARAAFPDDRVLRFVAPASILFLPVHLYTAPMLGNEGLNTLLCSLALFCLWRWFQAPSAGRAVALGGTLGLALLTKFTSVLYVAVTGVSLLAWALHSRRWRLAAAHLSLVGAVALALSGWFYVRNVQLYGTPFQMSREYFFTRHVENNLRVERTLGSYIGLDSRIFTDPTYFTGPVLESVWTGVYSSTWFDSHGNWFLPVPQSDRWLMRAARLLMVLGLVPTALVFLGIGAGVWRLYRNGWHDTLVVMLGSVVCIGTMFIIYTYDNQIYTSVKASYMLPAVVPLSFWLAVGVQSLGRMFRWLRRLSLAALAAMLLIIVPLFTYQLFFEAHLGSHHWNSVAVVDYFAGHRERARQHFQALVEGYDLYLAHENLASIAMDDGDLPRAIAGFHKALARLPKQVWGKPEDTALFVRYTQADYWNSLAILYAAVGWADRAYQAAQTAVDLDPDMSEARYNYAALLLQRGQPAAARAELDFAVRLDPGFADAYRLLAAAQQRAGDCDSAVETLGRIAAVRHWPRRVFPHATGTGDFHDAAVARRRWMRTLPFESDGEYVRSVCEAADGKVDEAAARLRRRLAERQAVSGALTDTAWRQVSGGVLPRQVLPNLLLVVIDTLRADHVGAYGYARATTPNLDRLARQGVRFDRAYSTSSWTRPAVASLLTGLLPERHEVVNWQAKLPPGLPVLAEELQSLGYTTAAFSANIAAVNGVPGFDRGFAKFELCFEPAEASEEAMMRFGGRPLRAFHAAEVNERVRSWLQSVPAAPIFLYVHYLDPHSGYDPPEEHRRLFGGDPALPGATEEDLHRLEREQITLSPENLANLINLYDGEIHYVDEQVGALLHDLHGAGFADNLVSIVTSDHGEEFQDHGRLWHAFTLYEEVIRVPLIVHGTGTWSFPPAVRHQLVRLDDLHPTLIELAGGVAVPGVDGYSLRSQLQGGADGGREALSTQLHPDPVVDKLIHPKRHAWSVRDSEWKRIDGAETELYRLSNDAGERRNLAAQEPQQLTRLAQMARSGSSVAESVADTIDEADRERMRALGYLP